MKSIGYHTPKTTKVALKKVLDAFPKFLWFDSSWENDLTDSICLEMGDGQFMSIYIPNSEFDNFRKDLFSKYTLLIGDKTMAESKNLEIIIEKIKTINKELYNL